MEPVLEIGPHQAIALGIILALRGADEAPEGLGRDPAARSRGGIDRRDGELVEQVAQQGGIAFGHWRYSPNTEDFSGSVNECVEAAGNAQRFAENRVPTPFCARPGRSFPTRSRIARLRSRC